MTQILKADAKRYAEFALTEIRRKRRIAMFNQARKYHKYLPAKWAMRLFKWWDKSSLGFFDYETDYWQSEAAAKWLLKKCCVEATEYVCLSANEITVVATVKKCLDSEGLSNGK